MRKLIAVLLAFILVLTGCRLGEKDLNKENTELADNNSNITVEFANLSDPQLLTYVEETVYQSILENIDSDKYFVENVQAAYVSQEYLDEVQYNSKENIYFGYSLSELDLQFSGTRYIFSVDKNGKTIVTEFEEYDDTYDQIIKNVTIGTGVILICVTVSAVSAGTGAPAVAMIFAGAAKTGTTFALSSAAIGGGIAGAVNYAQTGNVEDSLKVAALEGSEEFKWGAIMGAISGGASTTFALKGATMNGLTMNEAAVIQKESKWPLEAIKSLHSVKEYNIYQKAGLKATKLSDGSWAFLKKIDWKLKDSMGRTNIERVRKYKLAPIDSTGKSYELHHIGQKSDSPLAILSYEEHHSKENFGILHYAEEGKNVPDNVWRKQKEEFWKTILDMAKVD